MFETDGCLSLHRCVRLLQATHLILPPSKEFPCPSRLIQSSRSPRPVSACGATSKALLSLPPAHRPVSSSSSALAAPRPGRTLIKVWEDPHGLGTASRTAAPERPARACHSIADKPSEASRASQTASGGGCFGGKFLPRRAFSYCTAVPAQ